MNTFYTLPGMFILRKMLLPTMQNLLRCLLCRHKIEEEPLPSKSREKYKDIGFELYNEHY